MSDIEVEESCPFCIELLDATDKAINYCQCGYKMCLWCWNQLMETASKEAMPGRCPNCRTDYDKEKITMSRIDPDTAQEERRKRKEKKLAGTVAKARKDLAQIRVVQRNLVYSVGLPLQYCREEALGSKNHFGQFGKIKKISVNRTVPYGQAPSKLPCGSAYITYMRPEDALRCIQETDGMMWEGRQIKSCFGTTKYCNAFLKGLPCNNTDCLYLHEIAEDTDSFSKEDMLNGLAGEKSYFFQLVHPGAVKSKGAAAAPPASPVPAPAPPPASVAAKAAGPSQVNVVTAARPVPPPPNAAVKVKRHAMPPTIPTPALPTPALPTPALAGATWANGGANGSTSTLPLPEQDWPSLSVQGKEEADMAYDSKSDSSDGKAAETNVVSAASSGDSSVPEAVKHALAAPLKPVVGKLSKALKGAKANGNGTTSTACTSPPPAMGSLASHTPSEGSQSSTSPSGDDKENTPAGGPADPAPGDRAPNGLTKFTAAQETGGSFLDKLSAQPMSDLEGLGGLSGPWSGGFPASASNPALQQGKPLAPAWGDAPALQSHRIWGTEPDKWDSMASSAWGEEDISTPGSSLWGEGGQEGSSSSARQASGQKWTEVCGAAAAAHPEASVPLPIPVVQPAARPKGPPPGFETVATRASSIPTANTAALLSKPPPPGFEATRPAALMAGTGAAAPASAPFAVPHVEGAEAGETQRAWQAVTELSPLLSADLDATATLTPAAVRSLDSPVAYQPLLHAPAFCATPGHQGADAGVAPSSSALPVPVAPAPARRLFTSDQAFDVNAFFTQPSPPLGMDPLAMHDAALAAPAAALPPPAAVPVLMAGGTARERSRFSFAQHDSSAAGSPVVPPQLPMRLQGYLPEAGLGGQRPLAPAEQQQQQRYGPPPPPPNGGNTDFVAGFLKSFLPGVNVSVRQSPPGQQHMMQPTQYGVPPNGMGYGLGASPSPPHNPGMALLQQLQRHQSQRHDMNSGVALPGPLQHLQQLHGDGQGPYGGLPQPQQLMGQHLGGALPPVELSFAAWKADEVALPPHLSPQFGSTPVGAGLPHPAAQYQPHKPAMPPGFAVGVRI